MPHNGRTFTVHSYVQRESREGERTRRWPMRQDEHEQAARAIPPAAARRLRLMPPAEPDLLTRDDPGEGEMRLDYDELARALLRHLLRSLQTS